MNGTTEVTVADLFRALPGRTLLYTLGPVLIAFAQFVNSYYHGLSMLYPTVFGAVMVAFSVLATRYHMVELRLARLHDELFGAE